MSPSGREHFEKKRWKYLHPRFRVVTSSEVVAQHEQSYVIKLRQKSVISEKAFQENLTNGAASLKWQDSVKSFGQKIRSLSREDSARSGSEEGKRVKKTEQVNLFLVLLPKSGVKHSPLFSKLVRVQSRNFYACAYVDFLNLCREVFNEAGKINYIYDQDGHLIEDISEVDDRDILFVKRDPGFHLSEKDFNHVIRTLERD